MAQKIVNLSKRAYRALNITGYARMDFRLTPEGGIYLLEANPNLTWRDVKLLLAHGADAELMDGDGRRPGHLLVSGCSPRRRHGPAVSVAPGLSARAVDDVSGAPRRGRRP